MTRVDFATYNKAVNKIVESKGMIVNLAHPESNTRFRQHLLDYHGKKVGLCDDTKSGVESWVDMSLLN